MSQTFHTIRVNVDPTNPGHFFACCGLFELASRIAEDTEGWFEDKHFYLLSKKGLKDLIGTIAIADLRQIDPNDDKESPIEILLPCGWLRLDWWQDIYSGGRDIKVWAGSMCGFRIARAMQYAMRSGRYASEEIFDIGQVTYEPKDHKKKVEPFYFDARRGLNAHSLDIGFSPNKLNMSTIAYPAVEFLCLIGLQRCQPAKTENNRVFRYFTWGKPILAEIMSVAVIGLLTQIDQVMYEFENSYRTGKKMHKAFRFATQKQ